VAARLAEVRSRVGHDVRIVAVTKGHGVDAVRAALAAGLADVGENYAQELVAKAADVAMAAKVDGAGARWHFLGAVQRNKVKSLTPLVSMWHGVDRPLDLPGDVLVQVNLSGLPQRNGVHWDDAAALAARVGAVGLMGVAGPGDPRPQFRRLRGLADELGLGEVSMGMSGDYEVAVEEGATLLRLGTALFGPRPGPLPQRPDLRR
jgi:uncharacterized pyridoxal phosphate-containing UPF0001 family protein